MQASALLDIPEGESLGFKNLDDYRRQAGARDLAGNKVLSNEAGATANGAYSTSKAALIHMTRSLAVALAPRVRVNAIAPAFTDTEWMRNHFGAEYDERVARAARSIPLGRIGRPEDMAAAIVGLVTGGDFVTGQTLLVDGGLSIV